MKKKKPLSKKDQDKAFEKQAKQIEQEEDEFFLKEFVPCPIDWYMGKE